MAPFFMRKKCLTYEKKYVIIIHMKSEKIPREKTMNTEKVELSPACIECQVYEGLVHGQHGCEECESIAEVNGWELRIT